MDNSLDKVEEPSDEVKDKEDEQNHKNDEDREKEEEEEEESFCNPMISDEDEELNSKLLYPDRIGNTVYSERNVLKILLDWTEEIKKIVDENESKEAPDGSGTEDKAKEEGLGEEDAESKKDFYEELNFLWDMSADGEIMNYLLEKDILSLIKTTIESSNHARLLEVALGILANLLSSPEILADFSKLDPDLKLIELISISVQGCTSVPILLQTFAILNRITWFLRNVEPLESWFILLLDAKFIESVSFLLQSSRNAHLLAEVIGTLHILIELLSPEPADSEKQEYFENYRTFCESQFIPSLQEAICELIKQSRKRRTSSNSNENDFEAESNRNTTVASIQSGIKKGLKSLLCFSLCVNGKESLALKRDEMLDLLKKLYFIWGVLEEDDQELSSLLIQSLPFYTFLISKIEKDLDKSLLTDGPLIAYNRILCEGRTIERFKESPKEHLFVTELVSKFKTFYDDLEGIFADKGQKEVFEANDFRKSKTCVKHLTLKN